MLLSSGTLQCQAGCGVPQHGSPGHPCGSTACQRCTGRNDLDGNWPQLLAVAKRLIGGETRLVQHTHARKYSVLSEVIQVADGLHDEH